MWGHCGLEGGTHVSGILLPSSGSGWRMEGEGERGIGCQKAPIANEMEEDDGGEGDGGEERTNERDSSVESAMLPARARQAPGRPKMQGLAIWRPIVAFGLRLRLG